MNIFQRGVLPPVNFLELDATLRSSILGPSGTRTILQADLDATLRSSATWTPTYTGFSAAPVGDLTYWLFNGTVFVWNNTGAGITGTSNATNFTISNVPAAIRPAAARHCNAILEDNGGPLVGAVDIDSAGNATFSVYNTAAVANRVTLLSSGWTAAGSKGFRVGSGWAYRL